MMDESLPLALALTAFLVPQLAALLLLNLLLCFCSPDSRAHVRPLGTHRRVYRVWCVIPLSL